MEMAVDFGVVVWWIGDGSSGAWEWKRPRSFNSRGCSGTPVAGGQCTSHLTWVCAALSQDSGEAGSVGIRFLRSTTSMAMFRIDETSSVQVCATLLLFQSIRVTNRTASPGPSAAAPCPLLLPRFLFPPRRRLHPPSTISIGLAAAGWKPMASRERRRSPTWWQKSFQEQSSWWG